MLMYSTNLTGIRRQSLPAHSPVHSPDKYNNKDDSVIANTTATANNTNNNNQEQSPIRASIDRFYPPAV